MEDKYEVNCSVEGKIEKAFLILSESGEDYQIKFEMGELNFFAKAENYFNALIKLREKLETRNIKLFCKGCSRYVYPSPMILSMGDAIEAYELILGKPAYSENLINIFEPCKYDEYASVEEQNDYYKKWLESRRG